MTISHPRIFVLRHFLLTINKDCLLVEVKERGAQDESANVSDLPDWVFYSEHALWLTEEDKPVRDRARDGERIRQELLREFELSLAG